MEKIVRLVAVRSSILFLFAIFCIIVFLISCFIIGLRQKKKRKKDLYHIPAPEFQQQELGSIDRRPNVNYHKERGIVFIHIDDIFYSGKDSKYIFMIPALMDKQLKRKLLSIAYENRIFLICPDLDKKYSLPDITRYIRRYNIPITRIVDDYPVDYYYMRTMHTFNHNLTCYFLSVADKNDQNDYLKDSRRKS